jgi:hypothetical protein
VFQNFEDDISLIDKADDFHLTATLGTGQRIYFPNLLVKQKGSNLCLTLIKLHLLNLYHSM